MPPHQLRYPSWTPSAPGATAAGLPELPGRDPGPFGHRLELGPHDAGMDLRYGRCLRREAAIRAGDHILSPDQPGVAHEPLRDPFGVLDDVAGMGDHAG